MEEQHQELQHTLLAMKAPLAASQQTSKEQATALSSAKNEAKEQKKTAKKNYSNLEEQHQELQRALLTTKVALAVSQQTNKEQATALSAVKQEMKE